MVFEIMRFYCRPDMTSSWFLRQGSLYDILHDRFWKGNPDFIFMVNWHFLSILNGLDVIRRLHLAGISLLGATFWGLWGKMTQNVKLEKNTCWEGTSLCQTASFEPLCVKLSLSVMPVQVRKNKKAGRKKSHKKCIFQVFVERPLVGGFQANLAHVFILQI